MFVLVRLAPTSLFVHLLSVADPLSKHQKTIIKDDNLIMIIVLTTNTTNNNQLIIRVSVYIYIYICAYIFINRIDILVAWRRRRKDARSKSELW